MKNLLVLSASHLKGRKNIKFHRYFENVHQNLVRLNINYLPASTNNLLVHTRQFSSSSQKNDNPSNVEGKEVPTTSSTKAEAQHVTSQQPTEVASTTSSPKDPTKTHSETHPASKYSYNSTVQRIGSTLHFAEQKYEDFEQKVMHSIRESNRRRFRGYLFGALFSVFFLSYTFGDRLRKMLTDQTADLAKETLENESLKIQTQELAMAVVQTILNDKEITANASIFLREAAKTPETQKALLDLTMHVLQHPNTLEEVVKLGKKLIHELTIDQTVMVELSTLFSKVFEDPALHRTILTVLVQLLRDPEVIKAAVDLSVALAAKPEVNEATSELLQKSATNVLEDQQVLNESRQFVANVMGDEVLHREGGNALWNSVYHALKPGVIRIAGFGLVCVSFAALKLFLSPF